MKTVKFRYKSPLHKSMTMIANNVLRTGKNVLLRQGHFNKGRLDSNFSWRYDRLSNKVSFFAPKYSMILDQGARPHKPPIGAIIEWLEAKGHSPLKPKTWGIAKKIQENVEKRGLPSRGGNSKKFFIKKTIESTSKQNARILQKNLGRELKKTFTELTKDKIKVIL